MCVCVGVIHYKHSGHNFVALAANGVSITPAYRIMSVFSESPCNLLYITNVILSGEYLLTIIH